MATARIWRTGLRVVSGRWALVLCGGKVEVLNSGAEILPLQSLTSGSSIKGEIHVSNALVGRFLSSRGTQLHGTD